MKAPNASFLKLLKRLRMLRRMRALLLSDATKSDEILRISRTPARWRYE